MALVTLAPNSRLRTALLVGGIGLVLLGAGATRFFDLSGWGFLAIWVGVVLALNRLNTLIAVLGGLVVSLFPFGLAYEPRARQQAQQQEKAAASARAEAERRAEDALVAAFPQQRPQLESAAGELERLIAKRDWPAAENVLGRLDRALQPLLTSRLASDPGLLALRSRVDKARATLAPRLAEIREARAAEAAAAALAADSERLRTLLNAYKTNEVAADTAFKGRSLRITGVVGDIKKDVLNRPYVTLGTGVQFEIPVAQCFLAPPSVAAAASLVPGQNATLEGKVDGLMMNVLMSDCAVLKQ